MQQQSAFIVTALDGMDSTTAPSARELVDYLAGNWQTE
jgi:hypothetical protein